MSTIGAHNAQMSSTAMSENFRSVFGPRKPVIGMVHLGALPGSPLYNSQGGLGALVESAAQDLEALQQAGFDAVMFGNENDRPYELKVDTASTATMAFVIGQLRSMIKVPFGVDMLWDAKSSIALAARSEEHTSELQSQSNLVCRLLLEKKKKKKETNHE